MKVCDFFALRLRFIDLVIVCGGVLSVTTIVGFLGRFWWVFDLFDHFRVQFFVGLAALAISLLFPRRYFLAACFGVLAGVNLSVIAPLYFGTQFESLSVSRRYKAMLMNVNTETGDLSKVGRLIRQTKPDILVLEEINEHWLSTLSGSLAEYRYSKTEPREDNFGIGLFSKFPFEQCDVARIGEADIPSIVAEIKLPDGAVTAIATHPLPPGSAEDSRLRNDQLGRLPMVVNAAKSPVLLLGDLNATPWCYCFKHLLRQSGLHDSSQGRGVLPTWPTFLPLAWIPIDHCLFTTGIAIKGKTLGPRIGSDHYPLIVDFALTIPQLPAHSGSVAHL